MIKVYQTWSYAEAQYKVHISQQRHSADLFVYNVGNPGRATGNGLWYVTPHYNQANRRVLFCQRGMAELVIYFVHSSGQAGWQRAHRLERLF